MAEKRKPSIVIDRDNWQRDAERLRILNTQLVEALEWAIGYCPAKGYGGKAYLETYNRARAAIELARKPDLDKLRP